MGPSSSNSPFPLARNGFSLLELVAIIAVIAILASLALGVSDGVRERSLRNRTQAELALIASALEVYHNEYFSYPIVENGDAEARSRMLFVALLGQVDPDGNAVSSEREFVDPDLLSLNLEKNCIVDGWGIPLYYGYSEEMGWPEFQFLLISSGPDGKAVFPDSTGSYDVTVEENLDNVEAMN